MNEIELPCAIDHDLDWSKPLSLAKGEVFWHFGLGLPKISLDDELSFKTLSAALKHFTNEVYPRFEKRTLGASLYRGPLEITTRKSEGDVAAYFQMLAHNLPEELPLYLFFDAAGIEPRSKVFRLLSKERFEHFEVAACNLRSPCWALDFQRNPSVEKVGLLFPEEGVCSEKMLLEIEALMQTLDDAGLAWRAVSEAFLTEQWEGLDALAVQPMTLSPRGKRKLMGFCASGGLVATFGSLLGVSNEMSGKDFLEEVRGRGIRTPGLLVPNQSR